MKSIFLLSICFFYALYSKGQQKQLPAFGKVDKSELTMTECSFDKNAGAMMIFNEAESYFKINMQALLSPVFQQTAYRTRIKIFNKNGFDAANIKIKYPTDNPEISIKNLSAQTYNLDADGNIVVTKLDKSFVYDKVINTRYSEKIFVFPDVKEGSVIEYKYVLDGTSEDEWYFQKAIPVMFSRFILDFPVELRVSLVPHYNLPVQKYNDGANYSSYIMENIPALPDEPFMSTREDYLQRLDARVTAIDFPGMPLFRLDHTWPEIIKKLLDDEDFGKQLKKDIPRTAELDKLLQNVNDPYQKMYMIHKYVRDNMVWNNYDNIWALNGVKSAWKDKKGTSGEINLILINLLKDAGLNVTPLLVSTRDNGIINTAVPGYSQFNKVLAHVVIGDRSYILDAVDKYTPSYLIPKEVMASEGLLIKKPDNYDWGWINLWDDKHQQKSTTFINAEINSKGLMEGIASITSTDYGKMVFMPEVRKGNDKLKEVHLSVPGITIDSFVVTNAAIDTLPLMQDFKFTVPVSSSGKYNYFTVNLFSGFNKNPFMADERNSDVFYGVNQQYSINALVFLPEGYTIDALPKNIKMIMPDTSVVLKRVCSFEDGLLSVAMNIDFKSPIYSIESYPEFKEFYKKLLELLNEKFVYHKK
jgi:hypothetical protein